MTSPPNSCRTATLYSWPTRSRRTTLHHCSRGFRFFRKPRFFSPHLLLHVRKAGSDGSRMPAVPCSPQFTQRGETCSAAFFRFIRTQRSLSTSDQIKLLFDARKSGHVTQTLNLCGWYSMKASPPEIRPCFTQRARCRYRSASETKRCNHLLASRPLPFEATLAEISSANVQRVSSDHQSFEACLTVWVG